MLTDVQSGRSHPWSAGVQCGALNLMDRIGSTLFRALLCSGFAYVYVPCDVRELNDEFRLRSEIRRGFRRLEHHLAQCA